MQDIHDILPLIWPPDYSKFFWIFWIIFVILFLFILKKIFFDKKILKQEKKFFYSREKFLKDFYKIKKIVENQPDECFDKIFWEKLSKILKTYISHNHFEKIHFLSFWEMQKIFFKDKRFLDLEKIFKKFDEQFYFYEKKWREEFLELIDEIEKVF